jgi:PAS domain S-box-containing protein
MHDKQSRSWKVLIIDDEPEMHSVTRMVLSQYVFEEKPLEFLSAYSSEEARIILRDNSDIAIILLDIIMDAGLSGLALVEYIRKELRNLHTRIILRTGMIDQTPENKIIFEYDINDYKSKQELTYQKLYTSVTSALRSYKTIIDLAENISEHEREKELLAATFEAIDDGVIIVDRKNEVVFMNDIAEQQTGWIISEASGHPLQDILSLYSRKNRTPLFSQADIILTSRRGITPHEPAILVSHDSSERFVSYTCAPARNRSGESLGAVIIIRDETRRLCMEDEVIKAQKLESIGVLAGGIAHDFNNILTGILGKISLAKMDLDSGSRSYSLIGDAENAVLRAQGLTRQMLTFAKGNVPVKEPVLLVDLINETINIHLAGTKALAVLEIPENIPNLFADKGQILQVIGNLLVNAVQSMPIGGTIHIRAGSEEITGASTLALDPGQYVRIDVSDNGSGISEEDIDKIFEPFFSTKRKGNGLGLTTSHMIVHKHGGTIIVRSKINEGSTFSVYLPASDIPVKKARSNHAGRVPVGKSVLLMDDDETILTTTAEILKHLGYETDIAHDGTEAVAKYLRRLANNKRFDVVLLDLTIPGGMGGREVMIELKERDPQVRAILSSGYANDRNMSEYTALGFRALIAKPYRIEELAEVMLRIIDES